MDSNMAFLYERIATLTIPFYREMPSRSFGAVTPNQQPHTRTAWLRDISSYAGVNDRKIICLSTLYIPGTRWRAWKLCDLAQLRWGPGFDFHMLSNSMQQMDTPAPCRSCNDNLTRR